MSARGLHIYVGNGYTTPTLDELKRIGEMNVNEVNIIVGKDLFKYQQNESTVTTNCVNALNSFIRDYFSKSPISNMKVWISVPQFDISSTTAISNAPKLYTAYQNYIIKVKDALEKLGSFWTYNVKGIYFHTEVVHPVAGKISSSTPSTNPTVKLMNDLSYYIHTTHGKQFMWCPYYGYGPNRDTVIYNLGVVANRTQIFDVICIQPAYYFQAGNNCDEYNVMSTMLSASDNEVVDITGTPVAGGRTSTARATIGVNMEASAYAVDPNKPEYERFQLYKNAFGSMVDTVPMMFYGGPTSVTTSYLKNEITNFYAG